MNKLLVICGPTGTGKTDLALYVAKKIDGEIISADSRQVYRELNIGTGKDLPFGAKSKNGYYELDGIRVWGYDLVNPDDNFSVGQYIKFANTLILKLQNRKKIPIIVGGTGLYIKGVTDGIETASIPQNYELRLMLQEKKAEELFNILAQFDPVKAANMNQSDSKNPRRLIRAIEVAQSKDKKNIGKFTLQDLDILFIGLTSDLEFLERRVEQRIDKRISLGLEGEIGDLLSMGVNWSHQSMSSLGYIEWRDYFTSKTTKEEIVEKWKRNEKNYIKKQLVWFKKEDRINWIDISDADYRKKVENLVQKWYKQAGYEIAKS